LGGVRNPETNPLGGAFILVGSVCSLVLCLLFGEKCVQPVESRELSLGKARIRNAAWRLGLEQILR